MIRRAWCIFCLWLVTHWPGAGLPYPFKLWTFFLPWAGEVENIHDGADA